jgi:hypothetical protein
MTDANAKKLEILLDPTNFLGIILTLVILGVIGYGLVVRPIQHTRELAETNRLRTQQLSGLDQIAFTAQRATEVKVGARTVVGSISWKFPVGTNKSCVWQVGAVIRAVSVGEKNVMVMYNNSEYRGTGTGCWYAEFTIPKIEFQSQASLFLAARRACPERDANLMSGRCRSR